MKKILIVGAKKSGVYAALLAKKMGFDPFVTEIDNGDEFEEYKALLSKNGVKSEFGMHSLDKIKDFDMVVVSPGVPNNSKIMKEIKNNSIRCIGEMEFAFELARDVKIIAITGTNGKSTTTALTGNIFRYSHYNTVTGGNLGTPYSALLLNNPHPDVAILETSSSQLETIESFHPKVSVFLNFSEDHLDRYKNMDEYLKYKKRIFENQTSQDFALLNFDDPVVKNIKNIKSKVFYFSRKNLVERGTFLKKGKIIFRDGEDEIIAGVESIHLIGAHNIDNVLASVTAAKLFNIDNETIKKGIETFEGLPHRLEKVRNLNGVLYINDSKATTPDSTIKALNAFENKIVLIAGGSSKNNDFTEMARLFSSKLRKLILIGDTANEIAEAAMEQGFQDIAYAKNLSEAVRMAKEVAHFGDVVLLSPACASFDMFENFEDRGDQFKKIVKNL